MSDESEGCLTCDIYRAIIERQRATIHRQRQKILRLQTVIHRAAETGAGIENEARDRMSKGNLPRAAFGYLRGIAAAVKPVLAILRRG